MDELVEILLCEGGDVELCAQTSKHIIVFVFDPLSLTLSLILCIASYRHIIFACVVLILIHIAYSLYAWIVCVCLTYT